MTTESAFVLVTSSFPITGDGSEAAGAFVADFSEELAKHVPVRVVAPGSQASREEWSAGVQVFRYPTPDQPLSTLKLWHPVDAMRAIRIMSAGQEATCLAMDAGPVAHVLALWALPCGEWARQGAKRNGIDYSVWTLGSDIWSLGKIPLVRNRLRTILHDAKHCWSDGLKLAEDTSLIAMRPVEFLPSTRRTERVRIEHPRSQPPYRMLFLGRWHQNKGVDLLLDALGLLDDGDWTLIDVVNICGGGPLDSLVRAGVMRLQQEGRPVVMQGFLARGQAEDAILAADYFLIPSRVESIPVVFSDAMKLGCPVVANPVGDLPGLVGSREACGFVASSVTAAGFAEALKRAIRQAPIGFAHGVGKMSRRFDIKTSAQKVCSQILG